MKKSAAHYIEIAMHILPAIVLIALYFKGEILSFFLISSFWAATSISLVGYEISKSARAEQHLSAKALAVEILQAISEIERKEE